jgi:hypothetical protein
MKEDPDFYSIDLMKPQANRARWRVQEKFKRLVLGPMLSLVMARLAQVGDGRCRRTHSRRAMSPHAFAAAMHQAPNWPRP